MLKNTKTKTIISRHATHQISGLENVQEGEIFCAFLVSLLMQLYFIKCCVILREIICWARKREAAQTFFSFFCRIERLFLFCRLIYLVGDFSCFCCLVYFAKCVCMRYGTNGKLWVKTLSVGIHPISLHSHSEVVHEMLLYTVMSFWYNALANTFFPNAPDCPHFQLDFYLALFLEWHPHFAFNDSECGCLNGGHLVKWDAVLSYSISLPSQLWVLSSRWM